MGPLQLVFETVEGLFRFFTQGGAEQKPAPPAVSEPSQEAQEPVLEPEIPDDNFQPTLIDLANVQFQIPPMKVLMPLASLQTPKPWTVKYTKRIRWNAGEWEGTRLPKVYKNGEILTGDDYHDLAANLGQPGPRPKVQQKTGTSRENSGKGIVIAALPVTLEKQVAFKCPKGWWRWHRGGPEPLSKAQQKAKWKNEGYPSEWTRFKSWVELVPKGIKETGGSLEIFYDWNLWIGRRYYTDLTAAEATKAFISGVYQLIKNAADK